MIIIVIIAIILFVVYLVYKNGSKANTSNESSKLQDFNSGKHKAARVLHEFYQENNTSNISDDAKKLIMGLGVELFRICYALKGKGEFKQFVYDKGVQIESTIVQFKVDTEVNASRGIYYQKNLSEVESLVDVWINRIMMKIENLE